MLLKSSSLHIHLLWVLMASTIIAQGGCRGNTSIYNQNGLTVPFKNLCGKDIQKSIDFLDPTDELSWSDCLDRCVMKVPLCYGFDFTPHGMTDFSCWLMNATFAESDAISQTYTVDAAMLSPDFLAGLSSDCQTLGLQGCFQKNSQLGSGILSVRSSHTRTLVTPATVATTTITTNAGGEASTVITTVVTTLSVSTAEVTGANSGNSASEGLSTGAKAGIGVGIGVTVLFILVVATSCVFRRQKNKEKNISIPANLAANGDIVVDDPHGKGMAELQNHPYGPYCSPELPGSVPAQKALALAPKNEIHEIDGSMR